MQIIAKRASAYRIRQEHKALLPRSNLLVLFALILRLHHLQLLCLPLILALQLSLATAGPMPTLSQFKMSMAAPRATVHTTPPARVPPCQPPDPCLLPLRWSVAARQPHAGPSLTVNAVQPHRASFIRILTTAGSAHALEAIVVLPLPHLWRRPLFPLLLLPSWPHRGRSLVPTLQLLPKHVLFPPTQMLRQPVAPSLFASAVPPPTVSTSKTPTIAGSAAVSAAALLLV